MKVRDPERMKHATVKQQSHAQTHIILHCPRCKANFQIKWYKHYQRKNYRCKDCKFPILSEVKDAPTSRD